MRLLSGVGLVIFMYLLCGCTYEYGTPDSGEARILNDTGRPVLIYRCGANDCRKPTGFPQRLVDETFYDKFELAPGEETAGMNISRRGVPNVFLVLRPNPPARADEPVDVDKQRLGCLPFVMPHYIKEGLLAVVSEFVPCSSSINEDVQWPPTRRSASEPLAPLG